MSSSQPAEQEADVSADNGPASPLDGLEISAGLEMSSSQSAEPEDDVSADNGPASLLDGLFDGLEISAGLDGDRCDTEVEHAGVEECGCIDLGSDQVEGDVGCFAPPCPFSDAEEDALGEEDCEKEPWCTFAEAPEQQMLADRDGSMPKTENNIQAQDHAAILSEVTHQALEMVFEDQTEVWNAVTLCVNALEEFATSQHDFISQIIHLVHHFWHKANRAQISCGWQMRVNFIIKVCKARKMVYPAPARRQLASA